MDITKVSMKLVKYTFTKCHLSSPGLSKGYDIPAVDIQDVVIDNDYENYIFPFFSMSVNLPSNVLRTIRNYPLQTYISITMQAGYYDAISGTETIVPKSTNTFINDKFIAYLDKQDRNFTDSEVDDWEKKEGYSYKSTDPSSMEVAMFTLYKEPMLNAVNKTINQVITSANLLQALTYVLNSAGISNVLLSPPTKWRVWSPFIITPIRAYEQIDRICNDYGIHKTTTLIYFGLERNYLIEMKPECTAWVTNEYKTTNFYYPGVSGEKFVLSAGCAKISKEKVNWILLEANAASFTDHSMTINYGYAKDINVLQNSTMGSDLGDTTNGRFAVQMHGDTNGSSVRAKIKSYKKTANFVIRNADLEMFTPNKKFTVTVDDKKYKQYEGSYQMIKCSTYFVKEGNLFTPISSIDLRC